MLTYATTTTTALDASTSVAVTITNNPDPVGQIALVGLWVVLFVLTALAVNKFFK